MLTRRPSSSTGATRTSNPHTPRETGVKPISYLLRAHSGGARVFAPAVFVAGLILFAIGGQPSQVEPQDDTPPDPRFGAVETYHTPEIADEVGVGWTRIIFYWSEIERAGPDDWNWFHAPLDRIDREIAGGREVVGMVVHTPAWATDGLPGAGVPRGLYLPPDDPHNLWAAFFRDLVTAYQGRITHWIIWNEPDIPLDVYGAQWQGTTEDYYQLVRVAYLVANEVDPDIQIHLGALTYWHNPDYLREFLTVASADPTAADNGYYFDAVSAHIYFKPETTGEIIGSLRDALRDFGLERPIWITETNAPPDDDPTHPWDEPLFPVTMDMQASYLIQQFALALVEGVQRIEVYKWIDQPPPPPGYDVYGLLRPDSDPRPAFFAFEVIIRHFSATTGGLQMEQPEMQEVILSRGDLTT